MGKRQRRRERADENTDIWSEPVLMRLTLNGTEHKLAFRSKADAEAFLLDLGSGLHVIEATFGGWNDLDLDVTAEGVRE